MLKRGMKKVTCALALVMTMAMIMQGCGKQETATGQEPVANSVTESNTVSETTADITETAETTETTKPKKEKKASTRKWHWVNAEGYVVVVDINYDGYETAPDPVDAPEKLTADRRPDNILSAFTPEYGEKGLNHPNGIATDGTHFVVCDTWNNRVLVWNSLPTGNTKADVVIGQKDFFTFTPGYDLDQMNWPVAATFAGEKLIIADTHNNRLLVYDSVPSVNGAAADHVITDFSATDALMWPWEVWSDGTRLISTSTQDGRVVFWNNVDSAISGGFADQVIYVGGSPRTVITDGDYLVVGDHNVGRSSDGKNPGIQGSHVWLSYPTDGRAPDFYIDLQLGGMIVDGNLYGSAQNDESIRIYDGLIDSKDEQSVVTLRTNYEYFRNGDHNKMLYVDGKTYASFYNSGFIAIYDGLITEDNYLTPSGYIGADEKVQSTSVLRGEYQNVTPATDGESLVFIDDYNGLLGIYKTFPDSDNAIPDFLYHFKPEWDAPIDVTVDKDGRMIVLTGSSILIWNKIPLDGELYDERIEFDHPIGSPRSQIEACDEGILVYSEVDKTLYKLPLSEEARYFDNALDSVELEFVSGLTCNGKYVVVTLEEELKVVILNYADLSKYGEVYSEAYNEGAGLRPFFETPRDAIILPNGQFVAGDAIAIRVWDSLDEAISDRQFKNCFYMGVLDFYSVMTKNHGKVQDWAHPVASEGSVFKPSQFFYSHGHLWVGEFKFSSRLLRYDIKYNGED